MEKSNSSKVDYGKYNNDLEGKMALLRHEMFAQMGLINQDNKLREMEKPQKLDLLKILKRMSTKEGMPRKLPVIKRLNSDEIDKSPKRTKAVNPYSKEKVDSTLKAPLRAISIRRREVPRASINPKIKVEFNLGGDKFYKNITLNTLNMKSYQNSSRANESPRKPSSLITYESDIWTDIDV